MVQVDYFYLALELAHLVTEVLIALGIIAIFLWGENVLRRRD